MRTLGIILGVLAFFGLLYIIFRKDNRVINYFTSDGSIKKEGVIVQEPLTCTLMDKYGRTITINSTDYENRDLFDRICRGQQNVYYQNVWYYPIQHGHNHPHTGTSTSTGTGTSTGT